MRLKEADFSELSNSEIECRGVFGTKLELAIRDQADYKDEDGEICNVVDGDMSPDISLLTAKNDGKVTHFVLIGEAVGGHGIAALYKLPKRMSNNIEAHLADRQ